MASIKCAHCKGTHTSVTEVRACSLRSAGLNGTDAKIVARHVDWFEATGAKPAAPRPMGSVGGNKLGAPVAAPRTGDLARVKAAAARLPGEGTLRFAIERDGVTKFYWVDRPVEGRWAGYTFLKIQASDDLHSIRHLGTVADVLEAFASDVAGALARYGHELGACGVCGRTLTDAESRGRGIGPVCYSKL